jgi:hypothetical protein
MIVIGPYLFKFIHLFFNYQLVKNFQELLFTALLVGVGFYLLYSHMCSTSYLATASTAVMAAT